MSENELYTIPCPHIYCGRWFRNHSGLTRHFLSQHPDEEMDLNAVLQNEISSDLEPTGVEVQGGSSSEHTSDAEPLRFDEHDAGDDTIIADIEDPLPAANSDSSPPPSTRAPSVESTNSDLSHPQSDIVRREYHPFLTGEICDNNGQPISLSSKSSGDSSPEPHGKPVHDWGPFYNRLRFELADTVYRDAQLSARVIDKILRLWQISFQEIDPNHPGPFQNHRDLYQTIDQSTLGDIPWHSHLLYYQGPRPQTGSIPGWMTKDIEIRYRDPRELIHSILGNSDLSSQIDYAPYHEYVKLEGNNETHQFRDFFSGDWVWEQANIICEENESAHGAAFVPIILSSDKTTVSVGTGNNEFWPVYLSIGNIHNSVRRAHRNGVVVLGFLGIPKAEKQYRDDKAYRKFRRQLFHSSLAMMLETLRPNFTEPEVVLCGDGNYRRIIYGLGPYIADYPEQCLVSCIVQGWCPKCIAPADNLDDPVRQTIPRTKALTKEYTTVYELGEVWKKYGLVGDIIPFTESFPRADVHELLSPDILHQLIKGAFKDHLVTWIQEYIYDGVSKQEADQIMDDIDRRIACVPPFAGLRRFPQGRGFKQWTGDDSRALMKVYVPALEGYIPDKMVKCMRYFIEFCTLVRRDTHDSVTIKTLEDHLSLYHQNRTIFVETNIRTEKQPPRQHSLVHYPKLIRAFGAPNGLCSSISESKHIKAVKEPWRRSNRFQALDQMLTANQRMDKLMAAKVEFKSRGMFKGGYFENSELETTTTSEETESDEESDEDPRPTSLNSIRLAKRKSRLTSIKSIAKKFKQSNLVQLIIDFLKVQDAADETVEDFSEQDRITTHKSAVATFYAPSDLSGVGGMRKETIHAVKSWRGGPSRFDTVLVKLGPEDQELESDADEPLVKSFTIARARLLFSFHHNHASHACALVHDYDVVNPSPDENTGMAIVKRAMRGSKPRARVVPLDDIFRAVHLIPVFKLLKSGQNNMTIPRGHKHESTLDDKRFTQFYVNKYIDHHAFEILS